MLLRALDMCHTIVEFTEFAVIPAVGCTHEIARDALQLVNVGTAALRTLLQRRCGILVATVHAAVAIVVDRAVTHVQLIHHIHHTHNDLWVMCGITVNLHVEDMSTTRHLMIRSLYFRLVTGRALIVNRYVVGVGIIVTIGHPRDDAELLAVLLRELALRPSAGVASTE